MLQALRISNFAVIDEAEVSFGTGLTVLTGETGAGKSILVDALGLLLGGRADAEVVRAGCEEATVEGVFRASPALKARLDELGLPELGDEVAVRRVIGRAGRGKAHVNGSLVNVGVLARLMRGLVDIAGQHEHMSLFDPSLHSGLIDRVGEIWPLLSEYREAFRKVKEVDGQIQALGGDEAQARQRVEFLRFQLDEIERLDPQQGEEVRLEDERRRLLGAEKLQRAATEAEALVASQDGASVELAARALGMLTDAARIDPTLASAIDRVQAGIAELEEAGRALSRFLGALESDPGRLGEVDERLDGLRRLCKRHGTDLSGVLQCREQIRQELERLENRQGALEKLMAAREAAHSAASERAQALSTARAAAAVRFRTLVQEGLAHLAMNKSEFSIRIDRAPSLSLDGQDLVEFFFTANPGEPARPLARVASGGEASRVLLSLKRALAGSDHCATYVLDEADAGVGGAVAEVVGRMIKEVSAHRQVLCITHLPQVAAYADTHLFIHKRLLQGRTVSRVLALEDGDARKRELARMLSGVEVTREALGAAEALVRSANRSLKGVLRRAGATDPEKKPARLRHSA